MAKTKWGFAVRNRYFLVLDIIVFIASAILSFAIRLETFDLHSLAYGPILFLCVALCVKLAVFVACGIYARYWQNAGPSELLLVGTACFIAGASVILVVALLMVIIPNLAAILPRSVPLIDFLLTSIAVTISRFSLRAYHYSRAHRNYRQHMANHPGKRALIIGAGQTGQQVYDVLTSAPSRVAIVGFLDDDANKVGTVIRGLKVIGKINQLADVVAQYDIKMVIVAMPSAPGTVVRQIAHACQQMDVEYKIVPGISELITGKITVNALRPIVIDDLLRRTAVNLEIADIENLLHGRCVLVTGAGGSIGAELSRQIAHCQPKRLLLLGHGENSLFSVAARLKQEFPGVPYEILLADIQDMPRMRMIFEQWRPEIVFHAAAHKHVPMLEANVSAAVMNNVRGTRNLVELCSHFGAQRMIMISTDKAVHPTSVMGMSKRAAELIMLDAAQREPGRFAAVRFGNVLGSRGSVVPIFREQIAAGGPVTVTSPDITRFFMSIPEAVLLVLKASVLMEKGPLFVLNMGEPVPIVSLAEDLIRLSGLEPGRDIEIRFTSLRPGEKLYEELFWEYEEYQLVEQGTIYALRLTAEQNRRITAVVREKVPLLLQSADAFREKETAVLLSDIAFSLSSLEKVSQEKVSAEKKGSLAATRPDRQPAAQNMA